ncbi:MAG: DUF1385 domain-containing protein [Deltaproteobacteria bacterium]|nr:MAG: DUF1385 domain-containing protein [Deltaproteobacteria bacterium]
MSEDSTTRMGGQAVLEGVMMRSGSRLAVAVRHPGGGIVVKRGTWRKVLGASRIWRRPFLRGAAVLVETLVNGVGALNFSAEIAMEAEDGKGEEVTEAGKESRRAAVWATVALSVLLAIGLFVALPHMAVWLAGRISGHPLDVDDFAFHAVVGAVKLGVFVAYLAAIGLMADVRRLFAYHGAEHQAIGALEAGLPLEPEHAEKMSPLHPRCGTTFLIMVIAVSILVFALVFPPLLSWAGPPTGIGWLDQVIYVLVKIPLLVPVAGFAYELQRFTAGKMDRGWARAVAAPGLWLQKLTTRRPERSMLEVALVSLRAASLPEGDSEQGVVAFDDYEAARAALSAPGDIERAGREARSVCQA